MENGLKVFQIAPNSGILMMEPRTRLGGGSSPESGPMMIAIMIAGSMPKLPTMYHSLFLAFIRLNNRENRRK